MTLPENSELPLDVGLYGTLASISIAYWDVGEREEELADVVVEIVEVLTEANGWVAYDPQDERILRPEEMRAAFGAGHAYGVGIVQDIQMENEKPKRKRRTTAARLERRAATNNSRANRESMRTRRP